MTERTVRVRGGPGVGLEAWLVRTIGSGALKSFPLYYPPPGVQGRRPESYARSLLAALRDPGNGPRERQRACDDGRAFRGWAESPLASPSLNLN